MKTLVDGSTYNLGAMLAVYNKAQDVFLGGNCFIHRCNTIYKNWGVA